MGHFITWDHYKMEKQRLQIGNDTSSGPSDTRRKLRTWKRSERMMFNGKVVLVLSVHPRSIPQKCDVNSRHVSSQLIRQIRLALQSGDIYSCLHES